tara:strand:+ start:8471 stop:9478 length:1008 start_codon:yes stop_codon:yes gene_type:complete
MNIGFRVDSSSKIGTGHLHRCITLAKLFKKKGIRSFFFSRNEAGNVNSKIKKYGFELKKISSNKRDLANELDIIKNYIISLNINFVFIDNYSIKPSWEKKISQYSKIVLIDDFLTRKTYCDYYINYHLVEGIENKKFFVKKNCVKFLGPKYSIIKELRMKKKNSFKKRDILVFMGGVDNTNVTLKLISLLSLKKFDNFSISIIIGKKNKKKEEIKKRVNKFKNFSILIGNYENLYNFFNESKLCIVNAGVTMYETLIVGKQILIIPQSNLHKKILKNYNKLNMFDYIDNIKKLKIEKIIELTSKKVNKKILQKRKTFFDDKGASRIVKYFVDIIK